MMFAIGAMCAAGLSQQTLSSTGLDADMEKLNEYIQADKTNEQSVETLYADLQHRFSVMKADISREETDSGSLRDELKKARQELVTTREQVASLTAQLTESKAMVLKMRGAKNKALAALGLEVGMLEAPEPNATQPR